MTMTLPILVPRVKTNVLVMVRVHVQGRGRDSLAGMW
jgi:hypothetical protein